MHSTRRPGNPLDLLFQDLQKDLIEMKRKPPLRLVPHQSTYANPLNWTPGRAVELVHVSEGSVGVFREYFHKLSPSARRLLPAPSGTVATCQELVFGSWWLHPRNSGPPAPVETDEEIRERMSGNLCRCAAYANIVPAIREVIQQAQEELQMQQVGKEAQR